MSRTPGAIAADILLAPVPLLMTGGLLYMLFTVLRAATAGGRDRAPGAIPDDAVAIPVVATFAGIRGLPSPVAIASNSASPLFAIGPSGIAYRVLRKHVRPFAAIEQVDLHRRWRTVNIGFRFRAGMLTLTVNAGTDAVARTILKALPDDIALTPPAAILRAM